ncbi:hypothetical protein COCCU_12930 [Corynebacterium occultum]|uniref:Asparagine synthase n=1 Tax=Corynebacterium occultum TaxID=2675219 RepID=A0A6B8WB20_9CORY|nr:hypothetical protein [Corynebacterium occultum]QGU08485.1 hypothetical protein COCCU_12930 [Corynebacterium occultum]
MTSQVELLRQAFWHLRKGGPAQVRQWNIRRLATEQGGERRLPLPQAGLTRDYPRLNEAWKHFAEHSAVFPPASEARQYANAFAQGWILTAESSPHPDLVPRKWETHSIGSWIISHDPDLEFTQAKDQTGQIEVLILGHTTDSERRLRTSAKVAPALLKSLEGSTDWAGLDRMVTWLGGRFIIVARRGVDLRVHVDAMATRSCYWSDQGGRLVLASHSALVAAACGTPSAKQAQWVLSHKNYVNPAGKCLPGMIAPHDGVKLVFANCFLEVKDGQATHRRFFDTPPEKLSIAEATERYLSELRFQMDAALDRRPRSVLALTSGSDSRAILAGSLDLLQDAGAEAMTYHFFERNADHSRKDLLGANRLAELAELNHRVLNVPKHEAGSDPFWAMYRKTFPSWARFPSLARMYYESFSAEESVIIGIGGEVGTAFYRDRDYPAITPEVLASKFTQSEFQHDPRLIETMDEYMQYTQLSEANSAGHDLLDLFYWEHRMSSWAAYGYSEADFGPDVVLPLNSRRLLHAMLSLPYKDRLKRSVYRQLTSWSSI